MTYTIQKVINNNIVSALGEGKTEMILTGRGIGFGRKAGQQLDADDVQKVYHMVSPTVQKRLADLLEQIPYENLLLTDELVTYIHSQLSYPLNESLLITLADHISFALQRQKEGLCFTNPLKSSICEFYPKEYRLGCYCLNRIRERFQVDMPEDEAAFLAMHIVNAELNTTMSVMNDITRFIDGCVQVVEYYYNKKFDHESLDFSRFMVHLRFFAQRVFQDQPEQKKDSDELFWSLVVHNCKEHYKCAECIAAYVENTWHKTLSNEEKIFLTIHLKRINTDGDDADSKI